LHESCGVFGVYSPDEDVARLTFFALFALQHRGQESSGIATADGKKIRIFTGMGRVSNVFAEESLSQLTGHIAIGHNRYSTAGSSRAANAQPIVVSSANNTIAIAHNGNIINATHLYEELGGQGYTFHGTTDTEVGYRQPYPFFFGKKLGREDKVCHAPASGRIFTGYNDPT